jgi:protein O-GlcNAc transferase
VHTRQFWTEAGLAEVARGVHAQLPTSLHAAVESGRAGWTPMVEKVVELLGGYRAISNRADRPIWVDVGTGDGSLVMTALDYGFAALGLDTKPEPVQRMQELGFNAMLHDFITLRFQLTPDVLSMNDVLAQLPDPRAALRKAADVLAPGGVLILSTPDLSSSGWKLIEAAHENPYWTDLERLHAFSRERLIALLADAGFEVAHFTASRREKAQIALYAVRT